jgi:hypothetical protein
MSHRFSRALASLLLALAIALAGVTPASAQPPTNDDFDYATVIPGLPFSDSLVTSEATLASDEPAGYCEQLTNVSVWYSFTPATTVVLEAQTTGSDYTAVLSAYTGSRTSLTEIACAWDHGFQSHIRFVAEAGTTYYFRIGAYWGFGGHLAFSVSEYVPQELPTAGIYFIPEYPAQLETIEFISVSNDPEHFRFRSLDWNFGDGSTETGADVWHEYSVDGDYLLQHTVTTSDGRSATTSQILQVRTHDIAITKILAPVAAKAGQTRPITVFVKALRYDETVSVDLYKRGPDGDESIGYSRQFVPVRSGNRTTAFAFNYTFTDSDATARNITFYAIANIEVFSDADPENNEAISSPATRVSR